MKTFVHFFIVLSIGFGPWAILRGSAYLIQDSGPSTAKSAINTLLGVYFLVIATIATLNTLKKSKKGAPYG